MPRILTALLGIVLLGFQSVICIANTERRNGERVGSAMRTWLITGASSGLGKGMVEVECKTLEDRMTEIKRWKDISDGTDF